MTQHTHHPAAVLNTVRKACRLEALLHTAGITADDLPLSDEQKHLAEAAEHAARHARGTPRPASDITWTVTTMLMEHAVGRCAGEHDHALLEAR